MKFTLKGKSYLFAILLISLLSSCASRYKNALFTAKTDAVIDTLKTVFVVNDKGEEDLLYKIKPGDQIAVRNLQNLEFGAQAAPAAFPIELDGTVTFPVIGKVQLAGLTRKEATNKLQDQYSKILKDPIIQLNIINLKVTLLGEFTTQGNFLIEKDNTTFIDILGSAGGLTNTAEPKNIKIIRGEKSKPEIIYINLKDINSLSSRKLILQNNDIIYAEPRKIVSSNEKLQNIMTYVQPIVLILNTAVIIYNLSR